MLKLEFYNCLKFEFIYLRDDAQHFDKLHNNQMNLINLSNDSCIFNNFPSTNNNNNLSEIKTQQFKYF